MHTWHRAMDDTDVTNEKAADFEDGIGDPELEARLYAEIYFSNEKYEDDQGAELTVHKSLDTSENVTPLLSKETSGANVDNLGLNTVSVNKQNRTDQADFFYDDGHSHSPKLKAKTNSGQENHRAKNTTTVNTHPCNIKNIALNNTARTFPKPQRLLARKDLWLPKEKTADQAREFSDLSNTSLKSLTIKTKGTSNKNEKSHGKLRTALLSILTEEVPDVNSCVTRKLPQPKKKKEKSKKKEKNQKPAETSCGTKEQSRCKDLLNNLGVTTETSKYNIISKRMKLNMKQTECDTLSISSDSDDSILEVPIPPKAQPPLIELPDSDEDCDTNGRVEKKNRSPSSKRNVVKGAKKARNEERVVCEYDEPSTSHRDTNCTNEIPEELQSIETYDTNNSETICDDSTDLILNCSDPRKDNLNPEENRMETREKFSTSGITEKDKSRNQVLSGGEADTTRNSVMFSRDSSPHIDLPQNRDILDNSIGINSADETIDVGQNDSNNPSIDNSEVHNEKSKRKRQKDVEPRSSKESNVSEMPEKKRKRNTNSSSGNNSMTDYFFKPMSREMQAFYDAPCGSENMNVDEIQSRMPRNPSNWKILHVDLLPPTKKRGRVCHRCGNDTHHGKKCRQQASTPSCCMCGEKGHVETRCPQTMCLTCGRKYTSFRQTCCHCSKLSCDMCHGVGHTRQSCPDLWRRFHDITTETLPAPRSISNTMKDPQHLSCCNCARRGHDAAMCNQLRWSQHFPTPTYVSSYTEGPFYPTFQHGRIRDENISGNIDVVDVSNENDSNLIQSENESFEPRSLFQCGNLDAAKSSAFTVISKRLDTLPSVHLDGLLTGDLTPTFILEWQDHFTFNVNITQNFEEGIRLVVQADCHQLLHGIEKTLMQWLTRSDLEKPFLQYDDLPFGDFKYSMYNLKRKLNELDSAKDPKKVLTIVIRLAQRIQTISVEAIQNPDLLSSTTDLAVTKRTDDIQNLFSKLMEERGRLVMSLYARSWVEGGQVTVRHFHKLVKQMSSSQEFNGIREYMEVVYLYNELFTFHESEALTRALEAMTLTANPLECLIPSLPQDLYTTNVSHSSRIVPDNLGNNIIQDNNSTGPRSTPENCATTKSIGTDYQTGDCDSNRSRRMVTITFSPDEFRLPNSSDTLLLNPCRKTNMKKRVRKKKNGDELLINLTKKKRKAFRRSARAAIRLAKTSDVTSLRTMANTVKSKMADNSIRTSDIQSLGEAVQRLKSKKIHTKFRKQRKPETTASGFLQAFSGIHRTC